MTARATVAVAFIVLAGGCGSDDTAGGGGADASGAPQTVTIQYDVGYADRQVSVRQGGTVLWLASGVSHSVTWETGGLVNSGLFSDTFSLSFPQAGTYTYRCDAHPADGNNRVVVTP